MHRVSSPPGVQGLELRGQIGGLGDHVVEGPVFAVREGHVRYRGDIPSMATVESEPPVALIEPGV